MNLYRLFASRQALLIGLATVALLGVAADSLPGSTPRLNQITPRGVQRGHSHWLRFTGDRIGETQQVFLYQAGIDVVEFKTVDANNVDVHVSVSADCRLGEHLAQLRTSRGVTDFRSFFIGSMEEQAETEPNQSLDQAQPIELNRTINGVITNEDVDVFVVHAEMGSRLSVEIEALRLGYFFDPYIAIVNEQRFEIATSDDSNLNQQDGLLSILAPATGNYYVVVREASYGGSDDSRYRLHVGNFPRPTVAFPAGGPVGTPIDLEFLGDPTGAIQQTLTLSEDVRSQEGIFVEDSQGVTPSPVKFRVSDLANHLEIEPNEKREELTAVATLPAAFNGIISQAGDRDCFKFTASKGQVFDVNCFARRIRSGLDPVLNIFNAKGQGLVGDDDARRPDCYLRFTAPEDGEYYFQVRDHLNRGSSDFVYRVEFATVEPELQISIPRVDRYSQLRQQISVPQGNRFATLVSADRKAFSGSLQLKDADWPEGITVDSRPMVANLNLMPVVFSASESAPMSGKLVEWAAVTTEAAKAIEGRFRLHADFVLGPPNNAAYYQPSVDRVACAVTQRLPFRIDMVEPGVPLVRDGSLNLKIVAARDEGFDEPIHVEFPFRPPGLGTQPSIEIPKGKTEAFYPLNANDKAQIGTWPVYAIGQSNVGGPAWASTQLAELEIAEPFVTAELTRAACDQGTETTLFCKLHQHRPFAGEATAEILGIPPHIEVPKLTFTSETTELFFVVKTTAQSPIGKHRGLFCRITIVDNGESIVSIAARSELQINQPPAAAPENVVAEPPPNVAEPRKPKSRLEQLREAAARKAANG